MRLDNLLKDVYPKQIPQQYREYKIQAICDDSRKVTTNSLFIAHKGVNCDGIRFIPEAISKGAKVVVVNESALSKTQDIFKEIPESVCRIIVSDTSIFLKNIVKKFYEDPSQQLSVIGVTGTNGKTTCTYLIESILKQEQKLCGVIGTINYRIGSKEFVSGNTTPGLIENQEFLWRLVTKGIKYCVMEVSSHALDQGRVDLIGFKTAVFTNLTSDHLDYHENRENYFQAKAKLFTQLSRKSNAIINADDEYGRRLILMTNAKVMTYSLSDKESDFYVENLILDSNGSKMTIIMPKGRIEVQTRLPGVHNIYNILGAVAAGYAEGVSNDNIKKGVEDLKVIPGRLERIDCGQSFHVLVDYAHTEDALRNVLNSIKAISDSKTILVFGCGGDRD